MSLLADLLYLIGYGIYWIISGFVDIWKGKKETERLVAEHKKKQEELEIRRKVAEEYKRRQAEAEAALAEARREERMKKAEEDAKKRREEFARKYSHRTYR